MFVVVKVLPKFEAVSIFKVSLSVVEASTIESPLFAARTAALIVSFFSVPVIASVPVVKLPVCRTQKSPLFISFTPL